MGQLKTKTKPTEKMRSKETIKTGGEKKTFFS
jgi:hypothetical protein